MELSPQQWDRVKELFEAASDCSADERARLLRQGEHDDQVCAEVERLLEEQEKLGSFLSTPAFVSRRGPAKPLSRRMTSGEMLAGRFRIAAFIAAGGMGEVYKAEDTRLGRIVALKFLSKEMAEDRLSLDRFRREAKAASALNHPNICTVYDFAEDGGRTFIAMEYLEGETLSARIKRGPLPLNEALRIAVSVVGALSAAHRKGIIHRDLKPGNIMLADTGTKLLDFGLAKYEQPLAPGEETPTALTCGAQVAGTLPYMSPEQLKGETPDIRADIFAFGAVLYEMVTGKRAFERTSWSNIAATGGREKPKPVRELVKDAPEKLDRIILRCLNEKAEERYGSVAEIEHELGECREEAAETPSGVNLKVLSREIKRPRVAVPLAFVLMLLAGVGTWWVHRTTMVSWARAEALPKISALIEKDKTGEAFALAAEAERYIPKDPTLEKLWKDISWTTDITTTPKGTSVFRKDYSAPERAWEFVGRTPITGRKFPQLDSRWKFELEGHTTVERATFPSDSLNVTIEDEGKLPGEMVRVELNSDPLVRLWGIAGFEALPAVPVPQFWIDKFEVTNAQFKTFVDQGGYQKQEYWRQEFRQDGRLYSWADAMKLFVDKTGRPGPATWVQGDHPKGQGNYPVSGVSWYEAAAYAEFAGKSLPTVYHWTAAASPTDSSSMIPASNFGGAGPSPVGKYQGMSWCGAYDMAGNVKEWCSNAASSGKRYIMGGAWDEPTYMFNDADARSPFERSSNFGFRCAKYALKGEDARADDSMTVQVRNYDVEMPVSDQLFRAYKSLYSYDKTPLNSKVESIRETEDWKVEKVTFDAAYGGERVIAYLFLPLRTSPPFQAVVHFPGAAAVHSRSSADSLPSFYEDFDFIVKSGRAVLFPVYKGTFERGGGNQPAYWPNMTSAYRDAVITWSKDLGRSIDYLETRPDIDHSRVAYEGLSWGAAMGGLLPAVETRFKALVLISPGFYLQDRLPEVDQVNFAPRVKEPALMLNGRFDFIWPPTISQEPMYRLLGTPKEHKRRVVYESGHDIPRSEMIKETVNWLDRYLGPVH